VRAIWMEDGGGRSITIRWHLRDITERRRIEAARTDLLARLVTAQENERRRIARELHDEMGQHLTTLILDLKLLGDSFPADSAAREQLERVRRGVGEIGYAIHRVATALRPTALDDLGLHMTLRNHVADWSRHTGVRAEFRAIGPTDQRLAAGVETAL